MKNVPLDDCSIDAAVFSLSLMGTNYVDYLYEAYRCLKLDGLLWIAEPVSRIKEISKFSDLLFRIGFDLSFAKNKGNFYFIRALKSEREINHSYIKELNTKTILY